MLQRSLKPKCATAGSRGGWGATQSCPMPAPSSWCSRTCIRSVCSLLPKEEAEMCFPDRQMRPEGKILLGTLVEEMFPR